MAAVPVPILIATAVVALPMVGAALILPMCALGFRRAAGPLIGCATSALTAALVVWLWAATDGPVVWRVWWAPDLGIGFGWAVDGVSLLFALLVASIGLLAFVYSAVFVPRPVSAGYHAYLLLFTGSVLGLVLSADLVQLYLFWEMTDIFAFLLIGLSWRDPAARASARKVLTITLAGGLALLLGIVLLGAGLGSFRLPGAAAGPPAAEALHLTLAVLLIAIAAAAKSAQFPLHVWLPDSMRAPTPANAFLDSAAVLAAGVYLLVRLQPVLSLSPWWAWIVGGAGAASILAGAALALRAADFKIILAGSTVSQYGFIFILLGAATPEAVAAALFFLVQHGVLKAGLFFCVGAVAVATGVGARGSAGGLWRRMPALFAVTTLLALSLGGVPPLSGFWMKEGFLEAALSWDRPAVVALGVVGSALTLAYMLRFLAVVFAEGAPAPGPRPLAGLLLAVPLTAAAATIGLGLWPDLLLRHLVNPAASTVWATSVDMEVSLKPGPALLLSVLALSVGMAAFLTRGRLRPRLAGLASPLPSVDGAYRAIGSAAERAGRRTLALQSGRLSRYVSITLAGMLALLGFVAWASLRGGDGAWRLPPPAGSPLDLDWRMTPLLLLICGGALLTLLLRERIHMILALGAVGYLIAGVFALALAPNLGLLQVHVETLVTVLFILPLAALPEEVRRRELPDRGLPSPVVGFGLAGAAGSAAAWLSWRAVESAPADPVARWYTENAAGLTGAEDVVAAVLVHFRAFDTLGEIVVFATATAGVAALAALMRRERS
jgi:NADH:ubiquinone oxidoreductase subunit 5 (subunit L)/multisubunit Na+/H+ antiporter MnhA subunit